MYIYFSVNKVCSYFAARLFLAKELLSLDMAASSAIQVDDSCVLVLLQCRDREWHGNAMAQEAWAWRAAQKCISAGFGVLRVPTQNWDEVKRVNPDWFRPCFRENLDRQQVICTINFVHLVCPLLKKVHEMLQLSDDDNVEYCISLNGSARSGHRQTLLTK